MPPRCGNNHVGRRAPHVPDALNLPRDMPDSVGVRCAPGVAVEQSAGGLVKAMLAQPPLHQLLLKSHRRPDELCPDYPVKSHCARFGS